MAFLQDKRYGSYSNALIINTVGLLEQSRNGVSFLNTAEADIIALILANMLNAKVSPDQIGIITFYAGQRDELRRRIATHLCMKESAQVMLHDYPHCHTTTNVVFLMSKYCSF